MVQPNSAIPCRTQSLSLTTAHRFHFVKCDRPVFRSSQDPPGVMRSNSSPMTIAARSSPVYSMSALIAGVSTFW
jgi:hypothetical protein